MNLLNLIAVTNANTHNILFKEKIMENENIEQSEAPVVEKVTVSEIKKEKDATKKVAIFLLI